LALCGVFCDAGCDYLLNGHQIKRFNDENLINGASLLLSYFFCADEPTHSFSTIQ